ncbi:hypothetical protein B7494_g4842 [Chlorociboria aeruginascens]|nr:hypothetical protein B7494_g4842 [Chlorociboria aeruginascens]
MLKAAQIKTEKSDLSEGIRSAPESSPSISSNESLVDDEPKPPGLLVGCQNDPLIPSTDQICSTFVRYQEIWQTRVTHTKALPPGYIPAGSLEPCTLLQEIPPLPQGLPKIRTVMGEAIWHVPAPELPRSYEKATGNNDDKD